MCLVMILTVCAPRFVLFIMFINGYAARAYDKAMIPFLGFLFLPATTVAYAFIVNDCLKPWGPPHTLLIAMAVLVDLCHHASDEEEDRKKKAKAEAEKAKEDDDGKAK